MDSPLFCWAFTSCAVVVPLSAPTVGVSSTEAAAGLKATRAGMHGVLNAPSHPELTQVLRTLLNCICTIHRV